MKKSDWKAILKYAADLYLIYPNINAVGMGYKITGQTTTQTLSLQFSVDQKLAPDLVPADQLIPPQLSFEGLTVVTDVIQRSFVDHVPAATMAPSPHRIRYDVIRPGISVGSIHVETGTISALVRNKETGQKLVLSNWHVLQTEIGNIGDAVIQPGIIDHGNPAVDVIGRVGDSYHGPQADCAVAGLTHREFDRVPLGFNSPLTTLGTPKFGQKVKKSGRTTEVTHGRVSQCHAFAKIVLSNGTIVVVEGFVISPDPCNLPGGNMCEAGDSGAPWVLSHKEHVLLGIHCKTLDLKKSAGPQACLACFATNIFRMLNIELL